MSGRYVSSGAAFLNDAVSITHVWLRHRKPDKQGSVIPDGGVLICIVPLYDTT